MSLMGVALPIILILKNKKMKNSIIATFSDASSRYQFHQHLIIMFFIFCILLLLTVSVCIYLVKNIGEKAACKMLVKLTTAATF